jgi:hypothetical protein
MSDWEDIQARKYPPVGRCIYCGSDGGSEGLRDEHMVPYALGGHAELREASCRSCEQITSYIDGYLARHIFYDLRSHVRAPSRRSLPKKRPAHISVGDQGVSLDLPVDDHPFALMLPTWDLPGILRQVQPTEDFPVTNVRAYNYMPPNLRDALALPEDAPDPVVHIGPGTINNMTFARAITKIAYCNAIARYGLNGFRRLVAPDIVLGNYPWLPYFVGSEPGEPPPPHPRHVRHAVELATATGRGGIRILVASVRLFANSGTAEHGMPIYRVVMGAPR